MLNCYIVDDEIASIEIISDYIKDTKDIQLLGYSTKPTDVFDVISGPVIPDITFLDIDMPGIMGLELAAIINQYTAVVFISAFPEHGAEAFEKDAYDFLPKPISYARFLQAIVKVKSRMQLKQFGSPIPDKYFFVKGQRKGQIVKVWFDQIIYIEAQENFVRFHTEKDNPVIYLTLKELEFKLDKEKFIRIHKRFMVNIDKIDSLEGNQVTMENGAQLSVGSVFRNKLIEILNDKTVISDRTNPTRLNLPE